MASEKNDRRSFVPVSPSAFAELMALEPVEASGDGNGTVASSAEKIDTFRSLAASYPPGNGFTAFGGHVYAQAAYAASKTVDRGFVIHVCLKFIFTSCYGQFLSLEGGYHYVAL